MSDLRVIEEFAVRELRVDEAKHIVARPRAGMEITAGAVAGNHSAAGSAESIGASIDRIAQNMVDRVVDRQPPGDATAFFRRITNHRQGDMFLSKPEVPNFLSSSRTSPMVCSERMKNRTPHAVDVMGGGRSSAIEQDLGWKRRLSGECQLNRHSPDKCR
jgi:hypothetical protein